VGRPLDKDLLGVEDVAELMGVAKATIWRWCREGRLPCLKVGKHWLVRRGALENFLKRHERSTTLVGHLGSFLRVPDNVLAITQNLDILRRLDAAFFRVGEARGGLLVKFYAGEVTSEEELLAQFEENGLEAERLKREGRLFMRPEETPLSGRKDVLGRLIEEKAGEEGRTVWASFNWVVPVELETALEQQQRLSELIGSGQHLVVKTAALEDAIDEWSPANLRRAQSFHSGTIMASENGLSLNRTTPMPPS
jgi:excisionase family DNA binding protein